MKSLLFAINYLLSFFVYYSTAFCICLGIDIFVFFLNKIFTIYQLYNISKFAKYDYYDVTI